METKSQSRLPPSLSSASTSSLAFLATFLRGRHIPVERDFLGTSGSPSEFKCSAARYPAILAPFRPRWPGKWIDKISKSKEDITCKDTDLIHAYEYLEGECRFQRHKTQYRTHFWDYHRRRVHNQLTLRQISSWENSGSSKVWLQRILYWKVNQINRFALCGTGT